MIGIGIGLGLSRWPKGAGGFAPNFFVDSVNGNDGNDGLTAETALQTLAAAENQALAFGNGVKIGLVRGSHWREDLTLSSLSGVQIAVVGSGDMPIIDGSKVALNASFSKTPAYTNIYQITVTQTYEGGHISVWEDGVLGQFVSSLATLDATPGAFYIPSDGSGGGETSPGSHTVYVHASDSSDVTSNGKVYEHTDAERSGQLSLGDGATVTRIITRRNIDRLGSLLAGKNATIQRCIFEDAAKHNALVASGIYDRCVAWGGENAARTSTIMMEFFTLDGTGESCTFKDCIAVGRVTSAPTGNVTVGFGGHNNGAGTYYETWNVIDCVASKCDTGFSLGAKAVNFTRVHSNDCFMPITAKAHVSALNVTDLWFECINQQLHRAIDTQGSAVVNVDGLRGYVSNSVNNASCNKIGIYGLSSSTLNYTRSAIHFAVLPAANYSFVYNPTGSTINQQGVQYVNASGQDRLYPLEWFSAGPVLGAIDNNVYYPSANVNFRIDGTLYSTSALYLAAVRPGDEASSVTVDPAFTSPATGDFSTSGTGLPANSGVERAVAYHPVPTSLSEAIAFVEAT